MREQNSRIIKEHAGCNLPQLKEYLERNEWSEDSRAPKANEYRVKAFSEGDRKVEERREQKLPGRKCLAGKTELAWKRSGYEKNDMNHGERMIRVAGRGNQKRRNETKAEKF